MMGKNQFHNPVLRHGEGMSSHKGEWDEDPLTFTDEDYVLECI